METNLVRETSVVFRVCASLRLRIDVPYAASEDEISVALQYHVNALCQKISSRSTFFQLKGATFLLTDIGSSSDKLVGVSETDTVASYMKKHAPTDRKHSKIDPFRNVHKVRFLQKLTDFANIACSPVIKHDIDVIRSISFDLSLDVLSVVDAQTRLLALSHIFSTAICEQIRAMHNTILSYRKKFADKFISPKPYHYRIPEKNSYITVVYPYDLPLNKIETQRLALHKVLDLPSTQPLLRPSAAFHLEPTSPGGYLISPHTYIQSTQTRSDNIHLVTGDYTYHHYMQDKFDDNKWGCAYRSLQTLMSWFIMNGYATNTIPTHNEIQNVLCVLGDKEQSFVGSKKWIGSIEVGMVLQKLACVQYRIASVDRGSDMESKGRELANHFDTHRCPVMIGGGVLAHTILGVDFDDASGKTRFLILDPHYTGDEDLQTILNKGWCGWKSVDFWDRNASYNICMPIPPECL